MKQKIKLCISICFMIVFLKCDFALAQVGQSFRLAEGYIRIAQPGQVSDTLSVWGDVNAPGRYIVPRGITVHELISHARGPVASRTAGQNLDWSKIRLEITISRFNNDTGRDNIRSYTYRYDEPYPGDLRKFVLRSDDIISLEVKRKPAFVDWLRVFSTVVSATATTIIVVDRLMD